MHFGRFFVLIDATFIDDFLDVEKGLDEFVGEGFGEDRFLELELCVEGPGLHIHGLLLFVGGLRSGLGGGFRVDDCHFGLGPLAQKIGIHLLDVGPMRRILAFVDHGVLLLFI